MGRFNYTNRVDLFWSVDEDEKDIMIMVNTLSREFYVVLSFNQILEKIKKKHKNLIETNSKIFCEIFRGAFRKEGELKSYYYDLKTEKYYNAVILSYVRNK